MKRIPVYSQIFFPFNVPSESHTYSTPPSSLFLASNV